MTTYFTQKIAKKYNCVYCDFVTSNNYDFKRHCSTLKHKNNENTTNTTNLTQKTQNIQNSYKCDCGNTYMYRASLYNHKKKCNNQNKIIESEGEKIDYKEMLFTVIKQNKELQQTISELIPNIGNNNNNNNNNINQKFNINVFLNEQCKDALTMEQFINKIEVSLSNLLLTKNKGINEGISNIFIENMNKLSLYERPIHCTDVKRETIYVKSEGENGESAKWEKDENNEKVKGAIIKVTRLQHKNINKWTDNNPNWEEKSDSQDEYLKLIKNCTNDINENKVIKKLCDVVSL
jgi:hypothetical protein